MPARSQFDTERIRQLNDAHRQTYAGGTVLITQGVQVLSAEVQTDVLQSVRTFNHFDQDNDPHGEHDFGNFAIGDQRFFFKIDYFDLDMAGGSEDPADPAKTTRVLTIMRADEY
jgi:hypothetical protein